MTTNESQPDIPTVRDPEGQGDYRVVNGNVEFRRASAPPGDYEPWEAASQAGHRQTPERLAVWTQLLGATA